MKVKIDKKGKAEVKVHAYDLWNVDGTLAQIILPVLRKFKEKANGYPGELLPTHLESYSEEVQNEMWKAAEEEWDKILDSMIWSFEAIIDARDLCFFENGEYNFEKQRARDKKVQKGVDLFAKYFRALWI